MDFYVIVRADDDWSCIPKNHHLQPISGDFKFRFVNAALKVPRAVGRLRAIFERAGRLCWSSSFNEVGRCGRDTACVAERISGFIYRESVFLVT